jgi:hypothetical protein
MSADGSANSEKAAAPFCSRLAARLQQDPFGLMPWRNDNIETLWKLDGEGPRPPDRCVIEAPNLRIAGYLDLTPALLIIDSRLGTLGLVYRLEKDIEQTAQTILDQATYLRHLLVTDAGADARPAKRPYSVECVFSFGVPGDDKKLKKVFRDTVRHTSFWHAIGAHVLVCQDEETLPDAAMSRAFSWLLSCTRKWFSDSDPATPAKLLNGIHLSNYRLPGQRSLTLHPQPSVHLVHGQNGSGKSSLAEALELSVTGSVARLKAKQVPDYSAVIRYRYTKEPAHIRLEFGPSDPWQSEVLPDGVTAPLDPKLPVSAFRLDQDAMELLARAGSETRAEIFLRSFFPKDEGVYVALDKARETLDNIIRTLPPDLQKSLATLAPDQKPEAVDLRFGWINETRPPTAEECRDFEPLSRDALEVLGVIGPEIAEYLKVSRFRDRTHFDQLFKGLNEALERIRVRAGVWVNAISAARQCLAEQNVREWSPARAKRPMQDWIRLLERWSEQIALADLADKHWQIVSCLSETARSTGQDSLSVAEPGLFAWPEKILSADLAALAELREKSAGERDEIYLQLVEFSADSQGTTAKTTAPPNLTDRQIRALNLAGETLTPPAASKDQAAQDAPMDHLGDALEQAFTRNKPFTFAGIAVGSGSDWAERLSAKLEGAAKALATMVNEGDAIETRAQNTASYIGPAQRREILEAALNASAAVKTAAKNTEAAFLTELRNRIFNDALNELMALFTPARWAYDDVEVRRKSTGGKENLELGLSGANDTKADLLLNTAELNVFTVALYLLASPRVENPLGILLFDDPLQNMDELTVTTLARGIARVLHDFPAGWRLVFLFHGEDDLERFRQEVPAAVYLLPWLAPSALVGEEVDIEHDPLRSTFASELQNLGPIIRTRDVQAQPAGAA